jgi:hypothetical protein
MLPDKKLIGVTRNMSPESVSLALKAPTRLIPAADHSLGCCSGRKAARRCK